MATKMMRLLSSARGEEARRRLMWIFASYQGWRVADAASRPRLSRLRLEAGWQPFSPGVAISQLVATAEHFSAASLIEGAEDSLSGAPRIAQELWRRQQNRVDSTWDNQVEAWNSYFEVDFRAHEYFPTLLPFIEARNSVVHGLGALTRRQMKDRAATLKTLAEGGFAVTGNTLAIAESNVRDCRDGAENFIIWLDLENQHRVIGG